MFGGLKDKLKGWLKKSKEKVEATAPKEKVKVEKPVKEEKPKEEKKKAKKLEKIKKKTEKLEKIKEKEIQEIKEFEESREIPPEEDGTAIEIETGIEEGVPQDVIDEEIKEEIAVKEEKGKEVEEIKEKKEEKKGFLDKITSSFKYKITLEEFNNIFDDLEMLLLENNVALEVVDDLRDGLGKKLINKEIKKEDLENEIKNELKKSLNEILIEPDDPLEIIKIKKKESKEPFVILFFGINGTGKTTSIAKLAHLLKKKGLSVVLAAGDTFRAASIEQIAIHAEKLKVPLIKHDYGSDPSAVGFDAIKYAKNKKIDVVLIDTAGRMHTKGNLLSEMEKISRVTNPDLGIFVAESIAGNDATEQAKAFSEMIDVDGAILSKADIDEKGGTIISVSHVLHKPIFYLGVGQKYEDLELFDKNKFINSLGL